MSLSLLRVVGRRLMNAVPILLITLAVAFWLIQLAPGDVYSEYALNPDIRAEDLERFRANFGLDQPWYVQFGRYLWNAAQGDFGFSQTFKAPVFVLVKQRAANTLLLSLVSLLLAWGFSIPAGIIAAARQYRWQDQSIAVLAFFGLSIPNFFLAALLLYVISATGSWLPIGGMTSIDHDQLSTLGKMWDLAKHLVVPALVISTAITASLTRIMRANMLEVLGQQYITTARAKGLAERVVILKHALRNAVNPMITLLGFSIGDILGGSALVEIVTGWPGLGKLILSALLNQDPYLVSGSLIYGVILLMIGNLVADILLAITDPRIRVT
ncbi:MAG: ABC transporter permease [Spirochaetaceae bacterium]|nr:ABC transporter permease [Spirochaetaceae bacterium]